MCRFTSHSRGRFQFRIRRILERTTLMNRTLSTLCAAVIALTSLGASAGMSSAAPLPSVQSHAGQSHVIDVQMRRDRQACSPREALRKADRLGLRRARIVRETRRFVAVSGLRRGARVTVEFAQARGCPTLR
jgi:hypothetical protein